MADTMMLTRAGFLRVSAAAIAGGTSVAAAFTQGRPTMLTRPMPSSGTHVPVNPLPGWARELGCRTWAQVCLKYVIAHPWVTCVIAGTSRPEHMRENAEAGTGTLPDADLRRRMVAAFG